MGRNLDVRCSTRSGKPGTGYGVETDGRITTGGRGRSNGGVSGRQVSTVVGGGSKVETHIDVGPSGPPPTQDSTRKVPFPTTRPKSAPLCRPSYELSCLPPPLLVRNLTRKDPCFNGVRRIVR